MSQPASRAAAQVLAGALVAQTCPRVASFESPEHESLAIQSAACTGGYSGGGPHLFGGATA